MKKRRGRRPMPIKLDEKHELCLCTEPAILGMFRVAIMRGSTTHFVRAARLLARIATMRRDVGRKIMREIEEVTKNVGDRYLPVVTTRSVVIYLKRNLPHVEIDMDDSRITGRIKLKSLRAQDPQHAYMSLLETLEKLFDCFRILEVGNSPYRYLQPPTCPTCRGKTKIRVVHPLDNRRLIVRCLKCGSYFVAGRYALLVYSRNGAIVENLNAVTK